MNVIDCIILAGIGILTVFAVLFALSILIRLISLPYICKRPGKDTPKFLCQVTEAYRFSLFPIFHVGFASNIR